jgi:hypothetical protein
MAKGKSYSKTVKQFCTTRLEHILDIAAHIDLPNVFEGHSHMPGVVETRDTVGDWPNRKMCSLGLK